MLSQQYKKNKKIIILLSIKINVHNIKKKNLVFNLKIVKTLIELLDKGNNLRINFILLLYYFKS